VFDSRSTRRPCSRARHPLLTRVPPQCHAPARALLLHNECQSFHTPSSHSRCRFSLRRSLCAELRPWPPLPSGEAPAPLLFLHLRAFSEPTECATTFTVICRPPYAPFSVATAVVVPSPPEQPPASLLLARPAGHRPPLAMLRPPTSARQPPGASPSLPCRRRAASGRNSKLRRPPLL
jgi:hypothetical protein